MNTLQKILRVMATARFILGLFPKKTKKATRIVNTVSDAASQVGTVLSGGGSVQPGTAAETSKEDDAGDAVGNTG